MDSGAAPDGDRSRPYDRTRQASRARLLAQHRAPLDGAGMELIDVVGGTTFANNPLEAGSARAFRSYQGWWRFVVGQSRANPSSARWLGPLLLGLDWVGMRLGLAPSTKFGLYRRPIGPDPDPVVAERTQ
jgi:hypothetical protein